MHLLENIKRKKENQQFDLLERIPFDIESDENFADNEDNDDYSFDNEDNDNWLDEKESEEDNDTSSVIEIFDNSFNRTGGYVSHGEGITTEALDLSPWQFKHLKFDQ